MAPAKVVFTRETFQFFKDLGRHNRKEWMEANRDRYQAALVQPLRRLLEELASEVLQLDSGFDTSGRTGAWSRSTQTRGWMRPGRRRPTSDLVDSSGSHASPIPGP